MPAEAAMQDACGQNFVEKYQLKKFISSGAFGQVWACEERSTGEEFACKVFQKASIRSADEAAALRREAQILKKLQGQHPGIVQMKDALETAGAVQMVMEMCRGGDLYELIAKRGPMPEPSAKHIFRQLASALSFLHCRGIIHRDIKPENILLDRPASCLYSTTTRAKDPQGCPDFPVQAKLADFGLSVVLTPGDTTTGFTGSKYYTAPEMVEGKQYGRRVDVWSLGVVLCVMLTGKLPFAGKFPSDDKGLRRAIRQAHINFSQPCWQRVSAEARALVARMLQAEPQRRLKACELLTQAWCMDQKPAQHAVAELPVLDALEPAVQPPLAAPPDREGPGQELHSPVPRPLPVLTCALAAPLECT